MAIVPATVVYPNNVYILADRPGLKAGGTDGFAAPPSWPNWRIGLPPFTAAALRKARRHGGAVPWSMVKEVQNRLGPPDPPVVVPPPSASDAHYVSEIVSHLSIVPPVGVYWFDYMYGGANLDVTFPTNPGDPYVFQPNTVMAQYINPLISSWPNLTKILARPEAPVLSADDPYLDPGLPLSDTHLFHGPAGAAVLGAMTRMHLIKPANSGFNTRAVGSQAQYFVEIPGCGEGIRESYDAWIGLESFSAGNWSTKLLAGATYWAFGLCEGGWTYAIEIDPLTGKVADAYPMPEGRTREGKMFGAYLANSTPYAPTFWCMSWPTGVRSFTGGWLNAFAQLPLVPPKVMWKAARPWVYRCRARIDGGDTWNGTCTPPGFMPNEYYPDPVLWRGYEPGDEGDMRAGSGGWQELCSFPSADPTGTGDLGPPTWGTLPTPGQEVMLVFTHPDDLAGAQYGDPYAYLRLVPEATVSPINIPAMFGGVIAGGTP